MSPKINPTFPSENDEAQIFCQFMPKVTEKNPKLWATFKNQIHFCFT